MVFNSPPPTGKKGKYLKTNLICILNIKFSVPRNVGGGAAALRAQGGYSGNPQAAAKQQLFYPPAQEKILESSSGAFFGFNTTTFAERGLISGVYDSLAGIYDNIVQAYVEDVYTDVIEGYTIATIKVENVKNAVQQQCNIGATSVLHQCHISTTSTSCHSGDLHKHFREVGSPLGALTNNISRVLEGL